MNYNVRVIDFETTGIPDDENAHSVVEAAFVDLDPLEKSINTSYCALVVPECDIDIEAQAIHHISFEEATEKGVAWDDVKKVLLSCEDGGRNIYVAHNAEFEKKFFNQDDMLWIDTYKVALKIYPEAPSHSNQALKYFLKIEDARRHHPPHRALPDCHVTAELLLKMSETLKFHDMIQISRQPPYLTKMPFGKHYGQNFESIPRSYLEWLLTQSDIDEGVIAACKRVLL